VGPVNTNGKAIAIEQVKLRVKCRVPSGVRDVGLVEVLQSKFQSLSAGPPLIDSEYGLGRASPFFPRLQQLKQSQEGANLRKRDGQAQVRQRMVLEVRFQPPQQPVNT
jgi:hypothetical protein